MKNCGCGDATHGCGESRPKKYTFEKEVKKLPKFMRDTDDSRKYLLAFWSAAQKAARN